MQGKFVVFEGVEGCGKTTQIQHLATWLQASPLLKQLQTQGCASELVMTREPGGTDLGQDIRQMLLNPASAGLQDRAELLLYAADRAQHVEEMLRPRLAGGDWILCDRFTDSTVAYQGYGRGLDRHLIDQLNQIATDGLVSDLTFWLDVDVEVGLARTQQRGMADRMEQSDLAFHQRVQQGFAALCRDNPQRIVRIDASLSEPEVTHQIQAIFQERLLQWYPPLLLPS